jgi:hypothetical protein
MFYNDVRVSIMHTNKKWSGASFRMARPVVRDLADICRGHLMGGFTRVMDNCQFPHTAMLGVREMAYEAIEGAGYSKTQVVKAVRALRAHPRYKERCDGFRHMLAGYL